MQWEEGKVMRGSRQGGVGGSVQEYHLLQYVAMNKCA